MDVRSLSGGLYATDASPDLNTSTIASLKLGGGWTARVLVHPKIAKPLPGLSGVVLTPALWLNWLRQPLSWFPPSDKRDILKVSSTTLVARARMPVNSGKIVDIVCKRRVPRQLYKRLFNMVRVSRPLRTWRRAHALLDADIPTARPLVVMEKRRFGILFDSLIVTEFLENAVDLESMLTVRIRYLTPSQARLLKHQLADAVAGFILKIQQAGFIHRDFKALNIIVQWDPATAEPARISVVDLDGIRKSWQSKPDSHFRMLMRLNVSVDPFRRVSLTDRVRLLQRYLARAGRPISEWKSLWRKLAAMSDRKRSILTRRQEKSFRKYGRF